MKLKPKASDRIKQVFVDKEIGHEGFTYILESGKEDTVLMDAVLEYNKDPDYIVKIFLYKLTIKAQKLLQNSHISKREVIRRMGISPTQFYRLIDQTYYNKSIIYQDFLTNGVLIIPFWEICSTTLTTSIPYCSKNAPKCVNNHTHNSGERGKFSWIVKYDKNPFLVYK